MFTINNKRGFTLVELMVVMGIFTIMLGSGFMLLTSSQDAWHTTDAQIRLQDNLRQTLVKVSRELRETGMAGGNLTISNGLGANNSDIVKFSMPVICKDGGSVINDNGDVANWGAPLTWGCNDSTCMDKDDDCATVDYKYIQYQINASNQLVRRVLNNASALVREDIFAEDLTDFQAAVNDAQTVITLTATASTKTNSNRQITTINSLNVYLRNRG